MENELFNLTFAEAATKCLNGEGYIRGTYFGYGVYVGIDEDGILVIKDMGSNKEKHLNVDKIILEDKYRLFSVLEKKEFDRW